MDRGDLERIRHIKRLRRNTAYKHLLPLICVLLTLCLASCGKAQSNGLMKGASPETSALTLYRYDGNNNYCAYLYDSGDVRKVLDELDANKAVKAENWSLGDITMPVYGFWIGSVDGPGIFVAWSNGYWIAQDETAYSFDFDFGKLEQNYAWTDKMGFTDFAMFPCARVLTQDENGWDSTLLKPAPELNAPAGIAMALESWDKDVISVNFSNNSGAEWTYGEYFNLQVQLDGKWYEIPAAPGNWGFNDIAHVIRDGEEQKKEYHLAMYGALPTGTYRFVAYGLSVEGEM
jgi:hypothetical protein